MAEIPGFRNALLRRMANRLRIVDARLAAVDGRKDFGGPGESRQDWPSTFFTNATRSITSEAN